MQHAFLVAMMVTVPIGPALAHATPDQAETTTRQIEAIIHGEGKPGDVVVSTSDPAVSYTVLENGLIKRMNDRYSTMEVRTPIPRRFKNHDHSR